MIYCAKCTTKHDICEALWQNEAELDKVPLWETCKTLTGGDIFQFFSICWFLSTFICLLPICYEKNWINIYLSSVQIKKKNLGIRRMPSSWNLDFRQRFWLAVKKLSFLMISVVIDCNIFFSNVYCFNYSIYACIHWVFFFGWNMQIWAMYFTQKAGLQLQTNHSEY